MVAVQFRSMRTSLDLYLIATRNNRYILFSPLDIVAEFEEESDDRVVKFISWFKRHRYRAVAWFGGALKTGHEYYLKLENRIDPGERVLKAMASTLRFVVYHGPTGGGAGGGADFRAEFRSVLKRQRFKQLFWFIVDLIVSAVAIVFTPVLGALPGPNVFLYFPILRMLSHFRALRGTNSGLRAEVEFKCLPDLVGLEENLRTPSFDRRTVHALAEGLKIRGLEQFLERMV